MGERIVEKNSNEEFTLLRAEKGTEFLAKVSQLYFGEGRLRGDFDWAREEYVLYLDVPHRAEHISVEMTSHDVLRFLSWADIDSLNEIDGLEIECTVVSSGLKIIGLPDGIFSDIESHRNMTYPATVGGLRDRHESILWEDVAMKKYDGETATIVNPSVKNEQLRFDVMIENNEILNVSLPFPAIYDESNKSVQLIESLGGGSVDGLDKKTVRLERRKHGGGTYVEVISGSRKTDYSLYIRDSNSSPSFYSRIRGLLPLAP